MSIDEDIRWQQRFYNFTRAYKLLGKAALINSPSEVERAGLIQFFEMAFELSWKLIKDYLSAEGYDVKSPRAAIKQAFQIELIADGMIWLKALEDRNLTVHTYDEETAEKVEKKIRELYLPVLTNLYLTFEEMVKSD